MRWRSPAWSWPPACRCGCTLLIPAVENAIAGDAFRPGDVLRQPQGADRRDRQHRRRGPADPGRRPGAGRARGARADPRFRHPDRRGAGRARARPARRCSPREDAPAEALDRRGQGQRRSRLAPAAARSLCRMAQVRHRRHQQRATPTALPDRASPRCSSTSSSEKESTGGYPELRQPGLQGSCRGNRARCRGTRC